MEDNFSTDRGCGGGLWCQVVMRAMGGDGEQQMRLRSLARHSPPAVPKRPWSKKWGCGPLFEGNQIVKEGKVLFIINELE